MSSNCPSSSHSISDVSTNGTQASVEAVVIGVLGQETGEVDLIADFNRFNY